MKTTVGMLIVLLIAISVSGEDRSGTTEITVHSGWSFLNAENSFDGCPECLIPINTTVTRKIKDSFLFGAKGGYYFNRTMEIEGNFSIAPSHRFTSAFDILCIPGLPCPVDVSIAFPPLFTDTNAVAYHYSANFVYNIGSGSATPFVTFGVGGVSTSLIGNSNTDFAINVGGGTKFYFRRIGIRLELNDQIVPDYFLTGKTEHEIEVQYGFLFRLP